MYRLAFYFIRQVIPWLLLCLVGVMLVFLTTQLMRVAPVFAGSKAGLGETALAVGLILVPVAGWALTPAFAVALFATAGRMAADGELTALDSSGIQQRRLAVGPLVLALALLAIDAWIWLDLGPRSQRSLRAIAVELAARAALGKIDEGVFFEPMDKVTFYADKKEGAGSFKGVFIEDARSDSGPAQFAAQTGRVTVDAAKQLMEIRLGSGAAFFASLKSGEPPMSISFKNLDLKLPIGGEIDRHLDFLPGLLAEPTSSLVGPPPENTKESEWSFALWRRVAGPVGFLAFSLLCLALASGLGLKNRGTAAGIAVALFLAYHLMGRLAESLMQAGTLGGFTAALLPAFTVFAALAAILAKYFVTAFRRQ